MLPDLLKAKRLALEMTHREAAKSAGVTLPTYFRTETSRLLPTVPHVLTLCAWLGVTVEYAMTGMSANGRQRCPECVRLNAILSAVRSRLDTVATERSPDA